MTCHHSPASQFKYQINMKNLTKAILAVAVLSVLGSSIANADYYRNPHYQYGHNGYWDDHHHYHHWARYHDHDGYWDNRGGTRVFIDI
jgi:hypothetical protein